MNHTAHKPKSLTALFGKVEEEIEKAKERDKAPKIAVYARVSREPQTGFTYSIEIQEEQAEEYALKHYGDDITVYKDPFLSGKNSKRKELQRLKRDIKAGKIDVLIVSRLDRLYRNLESLLKFVRLLQTYKVEFISVTEEINTSSWWGRLVFIILGALAEVYVWQASEKTREAKKKRNDKGLQNGRIPIGYCNGLCKYCDDPNGPGYCPRVENEDRLESKRGLIPVPHPIDRHLVVWVAHQYSEGKSYREIANFLNTHRFVLPNGKEVDFRTKGTSSMKTDRTFNNESIRQIVGNPFYTGMVARYPRPAFSLEDDLENPENIPTPKAEGNTRIPLELHQGHHKPLISKYLWEKNTKMRKKKAHNPGNSTRERRIYPLTGVGRCWECLSAEGRRSALRGSTGRGTNRYYRCGYVQDRGIQKAKLAKEHHAGTKKAHELQVLQANTDFEELASQHKTLRSDKLEPKISQLVSRISIPSEWYELIMSYYLSDEGMTEFEYEGHNLRQALARFQNLYIEGHMSKAEFDEQALHLTRQLDTLKPSADTAAQEILSLLDDFEKLWEQFNSAERPGLLDVIFEGIYFDSKGEIRRIAPHTPFDELLGLPEGGITY
ncbi:MAG: recombinase family protein [Anaerolineae bacterium]|jgi:DNA invertase Pin-like site-specific DNA recombinase|nr:recombinase family protein [Anaerolineae bacterium]MBT7992221.1 recombinase family protein [Anaerolineae bacterium]